MESILIAKIAVVGALGVGAQWVAWRAHLPAIVLLTIAGIAAGPVTGLIDPVQDFGAFLRPMIAIAVAFLLFEGGLNLNLRELKGAGSAVVRLIVIGVPVTFVLASMAAHYLLGLSWQVAILFGAILVVTGPTVIIPMLRQAQLATRTGSVLKWEGIINDPVGALMAVIAFEFMITADANGQLLSHAAGFGARIFAVAAFGFAAGWLVARAFQTGQTPEFFKAPVTFAAVLAAFAGANEILEEGGLVTVTVMGATMANMRMADIEEMRRFKEYIAVLLVGGIFVLLTATLEPGHLAIVSTPTILFLAALLFVIRPVAVLASTAGTGLNWRERALIAWIAPRGVVLIAVTGFFATVLAQRGVPGAEELVPLSFAVVIVTVVAHGFSMRWLGRKLGLAAERRTGVFIVGANSFSTGLAQMLAEQDIQVRIADPVWNHLRTARRAGLPTYHGEVLTDLDEYGLDLVGFGYLLAASDNDAYNALVCVAFGHELGRDKVFQLQSAAEDDISITSISPALRGRRLVGDQGTYDELMNRWRRGWRFVTGTQPAEGAPEAEGIAILAIRDGREIVFNRAGAEWAPREGDVVISLVPPKAAAAGKAAAS